MGQGKKHNGVVRMVQPIRILIVDDLKAARIGLTLMLKRAPDVEVVDSVANGQEAVEWFSRRRASMKPLPDLVLMDIRMPLMNGIEATSRITRDFPGVKVLVMTTYDEDDYAFGALDAGATGYLLKDARAADLHRAVRAVVAGDAVLTPRITAEMIKRRPTRPTGSKQEESWNKFQSLSPRELEIAELIAQGMNNQEIAERLFIQPDSVKKTVSRILKRLGLRDRTQIVVGWYQAGM